METKTIEIIKEMKILPEMMVSNITASQDTNKPHDIDYCNRRGFIPVIPAFQLEDIVYNALKKQVDVNQYNMLKCDFRGKVHPEEEISIAYEKKDDKISFKILKEDESVAVKGDLLSKDTHTDLYEQKFTRNYILTENDSKLSRKGIGKDSNEIDMFYPISLTSNLFIEYFKKNKKDIPEMNQPGLVATYVKHKIEVYDSIKKLSIGNNFDLSIKDNIEKNRMGYKIIAIGHKRKTMQSDDMLFNVTAQLAFVNENDFFKKKN